MKRLLLSIAIIAVFNSSSSKAQTASDSTINRYDISKTVNATDTLMCLKFDMKPLNGIVYCEFGDVGTFVNGKPDGANKGWYEDGQLEWYINFKDGIREGTYKWWYENGQLEAESFYKDGKLEGTQNKWHESGQLMLHYNHKDGEKVGVWNTWYINGQLQFSTSYKDGKVESFKWWDEDGQLLKEDYPKNTD